MALQMKEDLRTIKENVAYILSESEKARNSDLLLWVLVNRSRGIKVYIEDFKNAVSFESVRRSRQKLNQEGKFLPSDDVEKLRQERKKDFKEVFGK